MGAMAADLRVRGDSAGFSAEAMGKEAGTRFFRFHGCLLGIGICGKFFAGTDLGNPMVGL